MGIALTSALSGCGDIPQARSENEIRRMAREEAAGQIAALNNRVEALETENRKLLDDIQGVRLLGLENASNAASLRSTVNRNVQIDTDNILKRATEEGRCGKGWVKRKDGTQVFGNVPCTAKDLWGED